MSGQFHTPAALTPAKNSGTHWMGGWVDPIEGLDLGKEGESNKKKYKINTEKKEG